MKSSYSLSLTEHRLIKFFISKVKFNDVLDSRTIHKVSVSEFANFWDLPRNNARKDLLDASDSLYSRQVSHGSLEESFKRTRWVWFVAFDKLEDTFEIAWTEPVIQHISLLRERFVKLDLTELVNLSSSYSFRLYEILTTVVGENSYKNPYFTIEQLMYMMDVPESCKVYKTFNNRILKTAIGELKMKVKRFSKMEIEEEKEKRKVIGIRFSGVGVGKRYKKKALPCAIG
jgi:plasmid replication initiation protein